MRTIKFITIQDRYDQIIENKGNLNKYLIILKETLDKINLTDMEITMKIEHIELKDRKGILGIETYNGKKQMIKLKERLDNINFKKFIEDNIYI